MTFEFTPDWMETLLRSSSFSPADLASVPPMPHAAAPAHPNAREVAALVGELFAEGTLSAEQFRTLISDPAFEPYLDAAIQPYSKTP
ncbi:hypothetical protein CCC_03704 [Paramagnetospirillum magnetotacticum MS-1]|uniref:Uncharacterized protein n=1 Tax=Paramagnetospirillum magnetotacticum MS-1 TaxID=272627 RepID=A0A0C2V007_PARME|nr:hypothetical protein [Paramagnetospirillum magnetotacticum]KIL98421.1 hypothetical protein CCC_03704 [Paramagnetospirillum magnetotacticum MS-1]